MNTHNVNETLVKPRHPPEPVNKEQPDQVIDRYPLSPMQQGMLFHYLSEPNSGVDFEQVICSLHEGLNIQAFRAAWEQVIARHAVLRTSFRWETPHEPVQEVHLQATLPFVECDWRNLSGKEQTHELNQYLHSDRQQGFDLARCPSLRVMLARLSDDSSQCVWSFHHILLDERSFVIVLQEVFALYAANCGGEAVRLPQTRSYREYIDWLQQQDWSRSEHFWRAHLKGVTASTSLPTSQNGGIYSSHASSRAEQEIRLSSDLGVTLKAKAASLAVSPDTLIHGAWAVVLSRYSGEEDVVFGVTRAVCHAPESEEDPIVGLRINTLPMRVDVAPDQSVARLLQNLWRQHCAMRVHENTPLTKIQSWSEISGGARLFESIVMLNPVALNSAMQIISNDGKPPEFRLFEKFTFPLVLQGDLEPDLRLRLNYDESAFDYATLTRMASSLQTVLEGMTQQPDGNLSKLPLLGPEEQRSVLIAWNNTEMAYPKDAFVHQLFERQAERSPSSIAVSSGAETLTYAELNQRANQLARYLAKAGAGPGCLVGICLERSVEMAVGLLAILKSGGTYVPLDPLFPLDRLGYMLEASRTPVVISQTGLRNILPKSVVRTVYLDQERGQIANEPEENLPSIPRADALAYVMFTSGSTGRPKGVQIPHRAVVNFLHTMANEPGITDADRLLSVTTLSFDISVLEIFLPLSVGARVVVATRDETLDGSRLIRLLDSEGITIMQATPATWRLLLDAGWKGNSRLKVLCGGEALNRELASQLAARCDALWNMYGPTETTVWSIIKKVDPDAKSILIGKPIANTQAYVLDKNLSPLPPGMTGELYIAGDGLATGYLNNPVLTRERFVVNPFSETSGSRMYRTGDLARFHETGDLECLGRNDTQVKIRGFRIELGEIEAVMDAHPAVSKAAVVTRVDSRGESRLVAYYVLRVGQEISAAELRRFLGDKLPNYMLPAAFVNLPEFPMTPNRKIDRKALPEAEVDRAELGRDYEAPRSEAESTVCRIWSELLGIDRVSIHDDFFALGGHSLMVLEATLAISEAYHCELPTGALFSHPTVAGLSAFLEKCKSANAVAGVSSVIAEAAPPNRSVPDLTPIASVVAQRSGLKAPDGSRRPYEMRESWICRWILAPLYRIPRKRSRALLQFLILKLEGGELFTVTLRKLYAQYAEVFVGDYTDGAFDAMRMNRKTRIGRYTSIYPTVVIQNADHPRNTISTNALFYHPAFGFAKGYALSRTEVQIGNDVFIGHNVSILYPTRKIGDGAVIAAGSVVVDDVPPYAIVGGYPARILRFRFSSETINEILKSRWWEASLQELEPVRDLFERPLEGDRIR